MAAPSTSHRRLATVPRSRSSSRRPCARRRRSGKGLLAPCSFPCLGGDCRAGLAQDFRRLRVLGLGARSVRASCGAGGKSGVPDRPGGAFGAGCAIPPRRTGDAGGNFFYAYLDINFGAQRSDVVVAKSMDGGQTFATFSIAAAGQPDVNFPDKEFVAVDHSSGSAHLGTIYVSWTDFLNPHDRHALDNGQIKVVVSRDGGTTWSSPVAITASAQAPQAISGSLPVVAPDGTAFIFYADFTSQTGPLAIRFSESTDGGATWTSPADVASGLPSPGRFRLKSADPNFGTVPGVGFRSNSFPTATIAPDGTIFVAWTDFPDGSCKPDGTGRPPCTNSDVRMSASKNGGDSWSRPAKVNDDGTSTDQFFPWIAAHPDGLVSIIFQDKRLDPDNINYDTFYASTTNGRSFAANVRVSDATSQTRFATFIGDYNGLAATSKGIFPVWTDRRNRNNDIFTAVGTR